jgi:hypothetical protein
MSLLEIHDGVLAVDGILNERKAMAYNEHEKKTEAPRLSLATLYSLRVICGSVLCALALASASCICEAQSAMRPMTSSPLSSSQSAIPAILKTFDSYEVVGMSEAHELQDVDDLILALIRTPAFAEKVNDIVVECGNMRYQPLLDQYIAGENVAFTDVQKVWRNATQPMCGQSAFFEQLYPLVRAINQKLPGTKRLRIVAADPPIDWDHVHEAKDIAPFQNRDASIASVMEKEVLSQHHKALMLFGIFHLLHRSGPDAGDAVTIYERRYPGQTFVISDLGYYGTDSQNTAIESLNHGADPTLLLTKGNPIGSLPLSAFLPTPITTDQDCNVVNEFEGKTPKPVGAFIDAFLDLGPQNLRLREPVPADIGLDTTYMTEWLRRLKVSGLPGPSTLDELNRQIVAGAVDPIVVTQRNPDAKEIYPFIRQNCIDRKSLVTPKQTP